MNRSIFGRVLLSNLLVILMTSLVFALMTSWLLRLQVVELKKGELTAKGQAAVALLQEGEQTPARWAERTDLIGDLLGSDCWVTDPQGNVVAGDPPSFWTDRAGEYQSQWQPVVTGEKKLWVRPERKDRSLLVALPLPQTAGPNLVFLYTPVVTIIKPYQAVESVLLYAGVTGALTALGLAFLVSRSLTAPIANISQTAHRFAQGDYSARTTVKGPGEIGELGATLNQMALSLAEIEQNRRDFLANVAHELKTPVASVQALTEAMLDHVVPEAKKEEFLAAILAATERLSHLIQDLTQLTLLEASEVQFHMESLDLVQFVRQEVKAYEALAAEKQVTLGVAAKLAQAPVFVDPHRLGEVLANLLSNGLRYSPAQSTLKVGLWAENQGFVLAVEDQGPGISEEDLSHIWERFYRTDSARARSGGGAGLGLSITRRLVEGMSGQIEVKSQLGAGTTFMVWFPYDKLGKMS